MCPHLHCLPVLKLPFLLLLIAIRLWYDRNSQTVEGKTMTDVEDNYNDAVIFVRSAINYIDDVLLDSVPFLSNIL